jgi:hypothetical protein
MPGPDLADLEEVEAEGPVLRLTPGDWHRFTTSLR